MILLWSMPSLRDNLLYVTSSYPKWTIKILKKDLDKHFHVLPAAVDSILVWVRVYFKIAGSQISLYQVPNVSGECFVYI